MKLNEADFAAFASSTTALDKAGWLWKRGAEFSHLSPTSSKSHLSQFKKRWFVLKGNLLFYFKHKTASTPVGMILLENCQVTSGKDGIDEANTQDFFHFELTFTHHLSAKHGRQYQLLAESPEDCQQWCKSISNASLVQSRTVAQKLWDRCHQNKRVIDQLVGQIRDLQTLVDHYDQQQHPRQIHARADIGKTGAGSDGEQMLSPDLTATDNDLEQMRESLNGIVRNLRSLFDREDADEETIRQQRNPTSSATTVIQSKTRSSTTASHSDQHQSLSVPGRLSSSLSHNLSNGSPIRLSSGSGNLILPSTVLNSSIEINKENKPSGNLTIQPSTAATAMMTRSSTINEKQQHSGLSASFTAQSGMAAPLNFSKTAVRSTARPQSLLSSSLPSSVNHTGVPPSPPALLTRSLSRRRSGESGVGSGLPPRFSALSMAMTSSSASDRISARSSTTIPERASAELSSGSPLRLNIGRTATAEEPQQSIASPTTSSSSSISSPTSGDSRTESREVGLPFPGFPPSIDDLSESAVHRPTAHDISFSCRLNPEIVSLMRNVSTSTITNNLVGSLVNGSTRNPETMIIMHERRFKRTDFGDDWGWYEIGRTELAELKDAKHVEFLVPLSVQFRQDSTGADYRFELHNFKSSANGSCETKCVGFIECTDKQLFSGLKERDRKSVSLYDSQQEKLLSVNLFTPSDVRLPGSSISGGEIVGELFISLGQAIHFTAASFAPFCSSPYDISQRYNVQTSVHEPLKLMEILRESPYAFLVPLALLKAFIANETAVLDELYRMERVLLPTVNMTCSCRGHASKKCSLPRSLDLIRSRQIEAHSDLKTYFQQVHDSLEERLSMLNGRWLRQSIDKKDLDLQWVALNCCQHDMVVEDVQNNEYAVYGITSVGAPAAHAMGFGKTSNSAASGSTFYSDHHLFAGQTVPANTLPSTTASSAEFVATSGSQIRLLLGSSKDQLEQYRVNFTNLLEQLRESLFSLANLPLHAEQFKRKALGENAENLIKDIQWVANDIINFTRDISWSSPYSSLSNRHKTPCGGFVQLNTEAELIRLSDRILGKYLPDLTNASRSLIINFDSQSKMERERIDDVLRSLKLEAPYLAPTSESLGGIAQASTNSLSSIGHCLQTVADSVSQLIDQSSDLLEQETLICDYLAMNSSSPVTGSSSVFSFASSATTATNQSNPHAASLQLRKRRDACLSQLLGAIVTGFASMVHRHFQKRFRYSSAFSSVPQTLNRSSRTSIATDYGDSSGLSRSYSTSRRTSTTRNPVQSGIDSVFWDGLLQIGYMAHFESLLSAQGDEKGMLEDTRQSIVDAMENVRLTIHCLPNNDGDNNSLEKAVVIFGSRHSLTVSIGLPEWIYRTAPAELASRRSAIRVFPVLFAQGINEQQVIANLSGESRLQERINIDGFKALEEFVTRWRNWVQRRVISPAHSPDGLRSTIQFQLPEELLDVIDGLMREIRSNMGLESYSPSDYVVRQSPAKTDPSLIFEQLRPASISTSSTDLAAVRRSSEIALTDPATNTAPASRKWKISIKNNTTLLLLVSHLVRILSSLNPIDPLGGCSSAFSDEGFTGGTKISDLYPTCPVASRFTSCKSAKDRTSMSVTLEHVLTLRHRGQRQPSATGHPQDLEPVHGQSPRTVFLRNLAAEKHHVHFPLHPDYFTKLLDAMRGERGCRLSNVERNLNVGWGVLDISIGGGDDLIGGNQVSDDMKRDAENKWIRPVNRGEIGKYAFNAFQWALLPTLYRPPMRVLGGNLT